MASIKVLSLLWKKQCFIKLYLQFSCFTALGDITMGGFYDQIAGKFSIHTLIEIQFQVQNPLTSADAVVLS